MSYARNLKVVGLALGALLLIGGVAAGNASAAQWLLNGSPITTPVSTNETGSIAITDAAGFLGSPVTVTCTYTATGTAGPGVADTTSTITVKNCPTIQGTCGSPSVSAVNLPWKTELFESGGIVRDRIRSDGSGAPGYKVECTVFGVRASDTCTSERIQPKVTTNTSPVPIEFDAGSGTADCTLGGSGQGSFRDAATISSPAGTLTVG